MTAEVAVTDAGSLERALERVAAGAPERDRIGSPAFPEDPVADLEAAGVLAFNAQAGPRRPPAADELGLVRAVARADASVGRIVDGHINGVERLAIHASPPLRDRELAAVRAGRLRVGVWGGEPRPDEGPPAALDRDGTGEVISGVKTFCSGAGGLDRALVLAREASAQAPVAAWIDLTVSGTVRIDADWYRAPGLRASASHRVVFDGAPVLARFGEPGDFARQPWFGRDALRTAAGWAGMADAAVDAALDELAARPGRGALEELAAGRIVAARATIDAWLQRAAGAMDTAAADLSSVSLHGRVAIVGACHAIVDEAARACGSHAFATGGPLDRARRDLELFLLQHRLDPALAVAGRAALAQREPARP